MKVLLIPCVGIFSLIFLTMFNISPMFVPLILPIIKHRSWDIQNKRNLTNTIFFFFVRQISLCNLTITYGLATLHLQTRKEKYWPFVSVSKFEKGVLVVKCNHTDIIHFHICLHKIRYFTRHLIYQYLMTIKCFKNINIMQLINIVVIICNLIFCCRSLF